MRQMKDSGIEWIGEIPAEWEVRKLRNIGKFTSSGIDKTIVEGEPLVRIINYTDVYGNNSKVLVNKEYMIVSSKDDIIAKNLVQEGDLIFTPSSETTDDIGVSALVYEELQNTAYSYHVLRFRFFVHVCKEYKKYLCNNWATLSYFSSHCTGTIRQTLSRNDFKECLVPLPSLPEQQRIAAYLDAKCGEIDKVMSKTRESIAEYKKLKQSIITEAVTNPKWEVVKLKYLVTILDEYRKPVAAEERTHNSEVLYDYYGASGKIDKIDGYTIDDHILLIGEDGANLLMRHLPLVYEVNGKAWINNHAHILKPNDGVNFYFVKYALESKDISVFVTGSAQPKLSQDNLKVITLMVPTLSEQQRIVAYLDKKCSEIDNLIAKKEQLLTELEKYKKSLIYECVTGKREVG